MAGRVVTSDRGFTYIVVLMMIIIMGIMLGVAGQSWQTIMQREREEELLFRGQQIKAAIERWHTKPPGQVQTNPALNDLKDLLKSPYSLQTVRYLRRLYTDPITGKEWNVVKEVPGRGIVGVFSSSDETPLKQANFPKGLEAFEGKTKYSDWKFGLKQQTTTTVTLPH
jgi:type II secretory pathway pseudopilin PulG